MVSTLTAGDEDYTEINQALEKAVANFNSALSHYGHGVGFKTFEYVEGNTFSSIKLTFSGIRRDFDRLLVSQSLHTTSVPVEKFLVPYDENPHFVGREQLLKDIREKLLEVVPQKYNHRVALYGLGGVGKTQTALAYVFAHKSDYDAIYWITGVNQASLLSAYQDIAKRAGLVKWTAEISPSDVAKNVLSWLRGQENWLLVIDNVDDISAVDGYLPDRAVGKHTLITTRNTNYYEIPAEGMEIGVLDPNDAERLLLIRSTYSSKADQEKVQAEAAEIVNKLGYLALAIEQAAAYIRETSKDIFRFLPSYQADRKKHHARIPRGNWRYSEGVATTWHLSFQQVEQNNRGASELLRLISFLNPDGILVEFLEVGKEGLPVGLRDLIDDTDLLFEALSELERFSLIRREDESGDIRITIHRLVQYVIKDEMDEDQYSAMTRSAINLCDRAFPERWEKEMRLLCRKYQEQVVVTLSEIQNAKSLDLLRVLTRVATFLHDDGKYKQAAELRLQVIDLSTALNGPEHRDTLRAMGQLAETYRMHRRWDDALVLHEKVAEIAKKIYGEDHLDTWSAMGDLAATYRSVGRRQEAVQMQEKVLDARLKALGEDHPETIRAMGNLGATYRNQRRLKDALKLQERVLQTRLKTLGDEHPDTLSAMVNIAVTYRYVGDRDRAAQLEEKVATVRTASLGIEHPYTLDVMGNLAGTYSSQKRWDDALQLQETVLQMRQKVIGEEHPETVWTMAKLAETYRHKGRIDEAVALQEKVLEIRRRQLGDTHPETLTAMRSLAENYSRQTRWGDAARLQGEVVEARQKLDIN
jgi:tetratricopeptide (TPR) repeat protein